MASILERRNAAGKLIGYQAQVRIDGRKQFKTFRKRADAEKWAAEVEVDIQRSVFVDRSETERNSLEDLITRYQKEVSPKKRGKNAELNHLKMIMRDEIVKKRMHHLSTADVAAFRDRMEKAGYAPATIVRKMNLVASIINHARREWSINLSENVAEAKLVRRPQNSDRRRERRLSAAEEVKLFAQIAKLKHLSIYVAALARLAIETGARQGELCSLTWNDIDLENRTALIRGLSGQGSKNGEIRKVPLSTAAASAIKTLPRSVHDKLLDKRLFPSSQETLQQAFQRCVARAEIDDLRFHDLRHEAISRLATVYTNPLELMRITGHKTLSMLARYYHADAAELAKRLA
jgi:integrase